MSAFNQNPVTSSPIADQNATQDTPFIFQFPAGTFTDADVGTTLTYAVWSAGDGGALPSWLSFDGVTRTFSGTPRNDDVGILSIDVRADDGAGGTARDSFDIIIANTNDDPVLTNPIGVQSAHVGYVFSFGVPANTFTDADPGAALSYSAQPAGGGALPAWLSFDVATGTFSGMPASGDAGSVSIDVIADDGQGGTVTDTFSIVIADTSDALVVANAIPNQSATEGASFTYQFGSGTFANVDASVMPLLYSAQLHGGDPLPAWLSFDAATRTFSGTPANGDVGTLSVVVLADDGNGKTASDTFEIVVANMNDAPGVVNPIANQNATEDAAFNFQFAASTFYDIDVADTLTYSAQLAGGGALPSWLSFDAATRTFAGTPINDNVGTVSIDVIADDGNGGTVTETFDIVVANTNDAPGVANPIPNQNATEDAAFSFQFAANAFSDIDYDTLTYSAQLAGGGALPAWLSFDAATRTFSGTPDNDDVGTVSIDVIADDGNGGTVTDTFNIVVANTNDAPGVANPIPNQNATEDAAFSFQFAANVFSDIDVGNTLTYSAQLAGGGALPGWLSFDAVTRTFSGTPINGNVGTVSIDVIADDGNGGTVTDTINIVVANTNDAPTLANPIANQNATEEAAFSFPVRGQHVQRH
ncbi:MAG: putative Ig domain-containing protein [Rhizobium sp.]|nr:putative Ig domain-containing protein [Rhizobium sp.]